MVAFLNQCQCLITLPFWDEAGMEPFDLQRAPGVISKY